MVHCCWLLVPTCIFVPSPRVKPNHLHIHVLELCTPHAKKLCGAREKKSSTKWINIQLAFRKSAVAANHDHHHDLRSTTTNKSPHTISTLHNLPHNHTSQSWATEQKQPRSASATPKMPAASQNLSSNRYVFFLLQTRRARLLSSSGRKRQRRSMFHAKQ
jgi:hypothetical protein